MTKYYNVLALTYESHIEFDSFIFPNLVARKLISKRLCKVTGKDKEWFVSWSDKYILR